MNTEKNAKKEVLIKIKGIHKNINNDIQNISSDLENANCQELIENVVETEYKGFYQKIGKQIYIKYIEEIKYDLFMDREYVSKCKIDITIKSL